MSLTANQKAFAQYLSGLWGKPDSLTGRDDYLPVGCTTDAGVLHSYRILATVRTGSPGKYALPRRFSIGGAGHFGRPFSTTPGPPILNPTHSSALLRACVIR